MVSRISNQHCCLETCTKELSSYHPISLALMDSPLELCVRTVTLLVQPSSAGSLNPWGNQSNTSTAFNHVYYTPIYNGLDSTNGSLGSAPAFASLQAEISPFATSLTGNPTTFHDHPTQLSSPMLNLGSSQPHRTPAPIAPMSFGHRSRYR